MFARKKELQELLARVEMLEQRMKSEREPELERWTVPYDILKCERFPVTLVVERLLSHLNLDLKREPEKTVLVKKKGA
jgi:hypothetical protein